VTCANGSTIRSVRRGTVEIVNTQGSVDAYVFEDSDLQRTLIGLAAICATGCDIG